MYERAYQKISELSERIRSGQYNQEAKSKRDSIVSKPTRVQTDRNTAGGPEGGSPKKDITEDLAYYMALVKEQTEALKAELEKNMLGSPNAGAPLGDAPAGVAQGYPMEVGEIEAIVRAEAVERNIDPDVAVRIFRAEGAGAYQSQVPRSGSGSAGGLEASYGPFQLYTGGGLGNQYQEATGRDLTRDNTADGITNQIRFALDAAVDQGWTPWYGRGPAGVGETQGLENARKVGNWS